MPNPNDPNRDRDTNPDAITGEPGSHPVGTGLGAAGGGAAGAAIGTAVGGPIGTVVGAVIGAISGGLAGKAVAEAVDPTAEDAYWREQHGSASYAKGRTYEDYQPAYRTGYESFGKYEPGTKFEDAESELREEYSASKPKLPWEHARPAAEAAWKRVEKGEATTVPISEEQVNVGKRQVEGGGVRLRKVVRTETVNKPVTLEREDVVVERVSRSDAAVPGDAFREGEVYIPLKEEEAVVEKTSKVVGEVRVKKTHESETENVQETVRKEDVEVDRDDQGRPRK